MVLLARFRFLSEFADVFLVLVANGSKLCSPRSLVCFGLVSGQLGESADFLYDRPVRFVTIRRAPTLCATSSQALAVQPNESRHWRLSAAPQSQPPAKERPKEFNKLTWIGDDDDGGRVAGQLWPRLWPHAKSDGAERELALSERRRCSPDATG
jgi:hypothetical protein